MKSFKKIICTMLGFALCLGLLVGCGSSNGSEETTTTSSGSSDSTTSSSDETTTTSSSSSSDDVYYFTVANSDSATSICEWYIEKLCTQMSEASDGRLQFTFNPGGSLLGATETVDGTKDGMADMCWTSTAFYAGRFPIAEFINLSANGIVSAQHGTEVFQAMVEQIPECAAEFDDWKIVATYACASCPISTVGKKIESASDMEGLQLRVAGTVASNYISLLGATPATMPTSDVYEALEKGTLDGFCNDWHNIDCFNLYEVIDYCMDFDVNYVACLVLMNQDKYDSLPSDLQAIVDEYCGQYAADFAGYTWDACKFFVMDEMEENGVEIYDPTEEFLAVAESEEIVSQLDEWYVDFLVENAGVTEDRAQEIFDLCESIVQDTVADHEGDYDTEFSYEDWPYDADTYTAE